MAERVGFEPTVLLTGHLISSQAPSTTRTPLRETLNSISQPVKCVNYFLSENPPAKAWPDGSGMDIEAPLRFCCQGIIEPHRFLMMLPDERDCLILFGCIGIFLLIAQAGCFQCLRDG